MTLWSSKTLVPSTRARLVGEELEQRLTPSKYLWFPTFGNFKWDNGPGGAVNWLVQNENPGPLDDEWTAATTVPGALDDVVLAASYPTTDGTTGAYKANARGVQFRAGRAGVRAVGRGDCVVVGRRRGVRSRCRGFGIGR